jgi:hypothetical protein
MSSLKDYRALTAASARGDRHKRLHNRQRSIRRN